MGYLGKIIQMWGFARSFWMYRSNPLRRKRLAGIYSRFIGAGDLCFDIGSHIGSHLSIFLALGARVVALEPHPGCARIIRALYGQNPRAIILEKAVSDAAGVQILQISTLSPTLSTLDRNWIRTVGKDKNFSGERWDVSVPAETTTLDLLVKEYGRPVFCKIDVEGAEFRVLQGLSVPLASLSFEYISAAIEPALAAVDRLSALGTYEYNWIPGEGNPFQSAEWIGPEKMKSILQALSKGRGSGDVYARLEKNRKW